MFNSKDDKSYTVWVGGSEVNDVLLSLEDAWTVARRFQEKGYDDVMIEQVK